jgi:hypothetical protein
MIAKTLEVLNGMVAAGVLRRYAIGGAVAALNYIEPTVTDDLDVLISFDSSATSGLVTLGPIVPYLEAKGYTEWRNEGLVVEGWPVQFLPVSDALDLEALERAEIVEDLFGSGVVVSTRVITAEHLVATALKVGRSKDFLRIAAFLEQDAVDLHRLKDVVERHRLIDKWVSFCRKTGQPDPFAAGHNP